MHVLFSGPTQSGKTLLCRLVARFRPAVVVFGTKPVDPSLDAYVNEGYVRIDHWPPTDADYRKGAKIWAPGTARFILWPEIKTLADLRRFGYLYAKAMDEIFIEGKWCVVVDEGLWIAAPTGLGLGQQLGDMCYGTASNGVSMYVLVQRPANVPPVVWTSVSEAELFHMGRRDDVRDLASLGTVDPNAAADVVQRLGTRLPGDPPKPWVPHRFLSLPTRGGADWSVSEVDLAYV